MEQLITQEKFVEALTLGIMIPAESTADMFDFGERLIQWINATDNIYWAAWDPEHENRVIMDLRNCELMQLHISPGIVEFRRIVEDIEHDMPKEFGNGAVGIMIFCMLENGDLEELDLAEILGLDEKPDPPPVVVDIDDDSDDFDWI
jgi:hypothetical protein